MRYALVNGRKIISVATVSSSDDLPSGVPFVILSEEAYQTVVQNPHLLTQLELVQGKVKFPSTLVAAEQQREVSKGKMRRVLDVPGAEVVFDGQTCFLQAPVESAKLSIVDETGAPVLTFQVDSPFPVIFPEKGELYCLSNNVTTYYVEGWK